MKTYVNVFHQRTTYFNDNTVEGNEMKYRSTDNE